MSEGSGREADAGAGLPDGFVERPHWFSGRELDVLVYKVNRRPLYVDTLFAEVYRERQPEDSLRHLQENILEHDPTTVSGTAYKRTWQIGNVRADLTRGFLTGRLGWRREGEAVAADWDAERRAWVDRVVPGDHSAVAPFAFIRDGRYLGVLRHPAFDEKTVAQVLAQLLNAAEQQREEPTTDWDVEPVGDKEEFYAWLARTDLVTSVEFVFKRPNPDAEPEFVELFERLNFLRAEQIREVVSTRDYREGLNKEALRIEPATRAFIAAAMVAYGYLVGRGLRRGRKVKYDQRSKVARERVADVGVSWEDATSQVLAAVQRAGRRKQGDGGPP